jgi:hypothetical protein
LKALTIDWIRFKTVSGLEDKVDELKQADKDNEIVIK